MPPFCSAWNLYIATEDVILKHNIWQILMAQLYIVILPVTYDHLSGATAPWCDRSGEVSSYISGHCVAVVRQAACRPASCSRRSDSRTAVPQLTPCHARWHQYIARTCTNISYVINHIPLKTLIQASLDQDKLRLIAPVVPICVYHAI